MVISANFVFLSCACVSIYFVIKCILWLNRHRLAAKKAGTEELTEEQKAMELKDVAKFEDYLAALKISAFATVVTSARLLNNSELADSAVALVTMLLLVYEVGRTLR